MKHSALNQSPATLSRDFEFDVTLQDGTFEELLANGETMRDAIRAIVAIYGDAISIDAVRSPARAWHKLPVISKRTRPALFR